MSMLILFFIHVAIYACIPFYLVTLKGPVRSVSFYAYIAIILMIGGFIGTVYSLPISDSITISGGNIAYGALMMTSILLMIVENDERIFRNIMRLVIMVNVFKLAIYSAISFALNNEYILNPFSTSASVFSVSIKITIIGGLLIISELFILLVLFEKIKKLKVGNAFLIASYLIVFIALLCLDGILFPTLAFPFHPKFVPIVIGGVKGKFVMSLAYSVPMLLFFLTFRVLFKSYIDKHLSLSNLLIAPRAKLIGEIQHHKKEVEMIREQYRLIFENSGEAIILTNTHGTVFSANPEACRMFQRSEDEIRKKGRAGLVDTNDMRLQDALLQRKELGLFRGELNLVRGDGTIFQAEVSSSVFKDSQGIERTSMIIRD